MTDYKQLCAELLLFSEEAGEICTCEGLWPVKCDPNYTLLNRARAALRRSLRGNGQVAELVNHARSSNTQAVALAVALEQLADAADEYGPAGGADGKALSEAVKRARKTLNRAADLLERLKELEQVNSQPS